MKFNFDNTYTQLPQQLFSEILPTKVKAPQLVFFNEELAKDLGIDNESNDDKEIAHILSGNTSTVGAANIAQAYSGHQFGNFTTLGDGRAVLLGEQMTPDGKRFDLQLKGAGPTPYSRRGDGRATLSSMLREYIFSEALHALNIPTTRSLAIVSSGESVYREKVQEGGILTRVASSHIRVGTFQHARQYESLQTQQELTAYTIHRHFPHLDNSEQAALDFLNAVMQKQITLIIHWMRVGFIHGVMNTDNMAISGESIDYGPCAFMNSYRPDTVFSSIDHRGRYAFDQQPSIALWNLTRLAESLLPQVDEVEIKAVEKVKEVLAQFEVQFNSLYQQMLLNKIGITTSTVDDMNLMSRLLAWMTKSKVDYTNTFVQLMYPQLDLNASFKNEEIRKWINDWKIHLGVYADLPIEVLELMQKNNPVYIPRNNAVEDVLRVITEESDPNSLNEFMSKITQPYTNNNLDVDYMKAPEELYDIKYKTYCGT